MYKNAAYQEYMDAIPVVLPEKYNILSHKYMYNNLVVMFLRAAYSNFSKVCGTVDVYLH